MIQLKSLVLCLQFLTRLYLPFNIEGPDDLFARGLHWFPMAGLVIGALEALVFFGASQIFTPLTAVVALLLFDMFITGGLHLDGLADTVDALSSHRSREKMLEIMKDSRIGTFGTLGLLGLLAAKGTLYLELTGLLLSGRVLYGVLIVLPVLGRSVMAYILYFSKYARQEGMGGLFFAYKKSMHPWALTLCLLIAAVPVLFHPVLAVMAAAGMLAGLAVRGLCYHKIGGMTGDTLGATVEIAEAAALMAAVLFLRFV